MPTFAIAHLHLFCQHREYAAFCFLGKVVNGNPASPGYPLSSTVGDSQIYILYYFAHQTFFSYI